jgi:hypothetical protein
MSRDSPDARKRVASGSKQVFPELDVVVGAVVVLTIALENEVLVPPTSDLVLPVDACSSRLDIRRSSFS